MIDHIAQVCQRPFELPAIDSLSCFAGVFKGDAEVGAVSTSGFALLDRGSCVADLKKRGSASSRITVERLPVRFSLDHGL